MPYSMGGIVWFHGEGLRFPTKFFQLTENFLNYTIIRLSKHCQYASYSKPLVVHSQLVSACKISLVFEPAFSKRDNSHHHSQPADLRTANVNRYSSLKDYRV